MSRHLMDGQADHRLNAAIAEPDVRTDFRTSHCKPDNRGDPVWGGLGAAPARAVNLLNRCPICLLCSPLLILIGYAVSRAFNL